MKGSTTMPSAHNAARVTFEKKKGDNYIWWEVKFIDNEGTAFSGLTVFSSDRENLPEIVVDGFVESRNI